METIENEIEQRVSVTGVRELQISDEMYDSITLRTCDSEYVSIESSGKEVRMLLCKNGAVQLVDFLKNHFSI